MKIYTAFFVIALVTTTSVSAQEKQIEYKKWKTFQSDYGYEFKYPDCWEVVIDTPEEKGDLKQIKDIAVVEGKNCTTPILRENIPNGIGISAAWKKINSIEEYEKNVAEKKKWFDMISKTKYSLAMKDFSTKESYSYAIVTWGSSLKNDIKWEMEFFCPTFKMRASGPSITHPDQTFLDEFKKGNLALPEPYKTIYESIKCIEPKKVEKKKSKKK